MKKLPPRFESQLFALLLTGATSLIVASVSVFQHVGWSDGLVGMCIQTWLPGWVIVFPFAMLIAPGIRKVVRWSVGKEM
jgi:hypothetical protein